MWIIMIIRLLKRGGVPFVNYLGLQLFIAQLVPQSGHPGMTFTALMLAQWGTSALDLVQ